MHLSKGLIAARPALTVDSIAIADGREGTVTAAIYAGFTGRTAVVSGPTGEPLSATFAVRGHEAVIEVAAASGLAALPNGKLHALQATSLGTGELIRKAHLTLGALIYIGAGGSACTDGGAGLLTGLGAKFLDSRGQPLPLGGGPLVDLASVDLSELHPKLRTARFVLASDVDNPLLGNQGASAIFGPQKGAIPSDVELLDGALTQLVRVLEGQIGPQERIAATKAGAGAAGGIGYAAIAVLAARVEAGFTVVSRMIELEKYLYGADLVITGEGSLDEQSLVEKRRSGSARLPPGQVSRSWRYADGQP